MKLKLSENKDLKSRLIHYSYVFCTFFVLAHYLYYNRYVVLACHDSMMEFAYARIHGWKWAYQYTYEFLLARGRYSHIFPGVISFRFFVHEKGNYLAVWLLQYVPVYVNILFLSIIIGRRAGKEYGVMYSLFFATFLQINVWHCLIICYPLEFMYGLFLAIWGVVLYQSYLEDKKKRLHKAWKMAVSMFCFYESMQSYEAFLVAAVCYATIALNYCLKTQKGKGKRKGILTFAWILIPHFLVAVTFLAIFEYLHIHPAYPDHPVLDVESHGNVHDAIVTWKSFTFSMFPLKTMLDLRNLALNRMSLLSVRNLMFLFICGLGGLTGTLTILERAEAAGKEKLCEKNRTLIVIGSAALAMMLLFCIPHAMTETYQNWVVKGRQVAYVPTTICYYCMVVVFACVIGIVLNLIATRRVLYKRIAAGVMTVAFAVGGMMTVCINDAFRDLPSQTNSMASIRAQTFFALCESDIFDEWDIDLLYTPTGSYMGIHGNIQNNETFMENVIGDQYDVEILNKPEDFLAEVEDYNNPAVFIYDYDAHVGFLMMIEDYVLLDGDEENDIPPELEFTVGDEVLAVNAHSMVYDVYVSDALADHVDIGAWSETVFEVPDGTSSGDIDAVFGKWG